MSAPMVMPTKVSEMNCGTLRQGREFALHGRAQHRRADIEIVAVEEHAGADQPEDAMMKRRDRQPVEPRAGIDRCSHVVSLPLDFCRRDGAEPIRPATAAPQGKERGLLPMFLAPDNAVRAGDDGDAAMPDLG